MRKVSGISTVKAIVSVSSGAPWGVSKIIGDLPQNRFGRRVAKKLAKSNKK